MRARRRKGATGRAEAGAAEKTAAAAARSYMFGALTDDEKRRAEEAEGAEAAEAGGGQGNSSSSQPSPPTSSPPPLSQLLLPPPRELAELLATLACNAHALSDASQGTLLPYGVALFPAAAMLNVLPEEITAVPLLATVMLPAPLVDSATVCAVVREDS